ncbi:MAG: ABC transporter ATP-binding protein [Streptosporangiaceae bacterium]|nr:ABC transporter ATP-binding protein [Streptosporangiaceae bacterium]MBV9858130.1 ABC transporter ATP-binding protein [Streptosporangiaceae bacterium]
MASTERSEATPGTAAGDVLIEVSGLCVDYGLGEGAVHAVVDADLVLRRGEVLGLAGESGSGKSTLAYAITRLLRPPGLITAGRARFRQSVDLLAAGEQELRGLRWNEIAVVLQSSMNALNPVLRIGRQITDVLRAHRPDSGRGARQARAAALLEMVGIPADRLGNYPHELSGGMRQRVMIAMALALDPKIVIMDEPTTALDVVTQREILEELMALRDRLDFAVLFISHDLSLLVEIADSIAVMYAGRLVERADAAAIFRAPRHPYSLGLLSSFPPLHGPHRQMEGIPGSPPDLRGTPAGCSFHPRCRYAFDKCRTDPPPLFDLDGAPNARGGAPGRAAACWLQDGTRAVPAELARPESGTAGRPEPALPGRPEPGRAVPGRPVPEPVVPEPVVPEPGTAGPGGGQP